MRTGSSKGSDDGMGVMIDIDLHDPTIRAGFSVYVGYSTEQQTEMSVCRRECASVVSLSRHPSDSIPLT